jgi:D123.
MLGTMEFRCFVKNNNLVAISQYNHYVIIEELLNEEFCLKLKKSLFEFWQNQIRERLNYLNDYVIDLAFLSDDTVSVIELNPYVKTTGPALFHWDEDEAILSGKLYDLTKPSLEQIHFRKRVSPYPNLVGLYNDFYYVEKLKMIEESPYWELLNQFDPPSKGKDIIKSNCSIF